jgi:hypothetical protein
VYLRPSPLWDVNAFKFTAGYRRFGSHLRESSIIFLGLLDPCKWDKSVVPERRQPAANPHHVTPQKSGGFKKTVNYRSHTYLTLSVEGITNVAVNIRDFELFVRK